MGSTRIREAFAFVQRPVPGDVAVYGSGVVLALLTPFVSSVPVYRQWAWIALGPFLAGALGSAARAIRSSLRARTTVAAVVFAGVVILPLCLEVAWRSDGPPGTHVQSETILTEEAAKALLEGHDPYATTYLHGPLEAWPIGTRRHYPYLPAMLLLGVPRALAPRLPLADARLAFLAATTAALAVALARMRAERRRAAFQILLVPPVAGMLLSGGGDDVAVAALMVLAIALAARGRPGWAGIVAGLAAAAKQPAWILVPFVVAAARHGNGRRARGRATLGAVGTATTITLPFILWDAGAFVRDTVLFPLGYGKPKTFHPTLTPGVIIARAFPGARGWVGGAGAAIVVALAVWLLGRGVEDAAAAARSAGFVLLAAIVLAPATRLGFVVYPFDLLAWSWLCRPERARPAAPPGHAAPVGAAELAYQPGVRRVAATGPAGHPS